MTNLSYIENQCFVYMMKSTCIENQCLMFPIHITYSSRSLVFGAGIE